MSIRKCALVVVTAVFLAFLLPGGTAQADTSISLAAPPSIEITTDDVTSVTIPTLFTVTIPHLSGGIDRRRWFYADQEPQNNIDFFTAEATPENPTLDGTEDWSTSVSFSAINVLIKPMRNGDAILNIYTNPYFEDGGVAGYQDVTKVAVHIAAPALDKFTPAFSSECPSAAKVGQKFDCDLYYDVSGHGSRLATPATATVWVGESAGGPWSKPLRIGVNPGETEGFSTGAVSAVVVYVKIQWNVGNKKATVERIIPIVEANVSAPGAAIVGEDFTVRASVTPALSGTCILNGNKQIIKISSGRGSTRVYGSAPGQLRLVMSCNNKNWIASSEFTMWIRG